MKKKGRAAEPRGLGIMKFGSLRLADGTPADLRKFTGGTLIPQLLGGTINEIPAQFALASPVTHIHPDAPPFFIYHGSRDRLVPLDQATDFRDALEQADVLRLRALGTTVVACPRSNQYVGVGDPPLEAFYATGVSVAFGTDSLASVADLNMFQELAAARRLAPGVSARTLIESATLVGARALGFGDAFGSIEAGKRAALIAVDLPASVGDVEEYLVSGIAPEMIQWVESSSLATRPVAPSHPRT